MLLNPVRAISGIANFTSKLTSALPAPAREFTRDSAVPAGLISALGQRVVSACPRLKAMMHATPWYSSPAGLYEYKPDVWFDGKHHYYAAVLKRQTGDDDAVATIYSGTDADAPFYRYQDAFRAARRAAAEAATMCSLKPQK
ncbi:hypothetical protein [Klebsiella aerogenes]|uniref:Uncharacterized protein n=1 Tax=Klebsiella aerogenes TaxID=548 RepID=A0AAP9R1N5_KLEAE|nr:hypothetical protein [Klebsiella aerogenes]QMR42932.1 hypothetical protein HV331_25830 [Klebsiella aerogenes]